MKLIRSRLGGDVDLPTAVAPKLRIVRIGLNLELLNGFRGQPDGGNRHRDIVVVRAVNREVVVAGALTVDADPARTWRPERIGRQHRQVVDVTSGGEGQFHDPACLESGADGWGVAVQRHDAVGADGDGIGLFANLQRDIEAGVIGRNDANIRIFAPLEAFLFDDDPIDAGVKGRDAVAAGVIRRGFPRLISGLIRDDDARPNHGGAGLVRDGAGHGAPGKLSPAHRRQSDHPQQRKAQDEPVAIPSAHPSQAMQHTNFLNLHRLASPRR